jgi:hypothetical protein
VIVKRLSAFAVLRVAVTALAVCDRNTAILCLQAVGLFLALYWDFTVCVGISMSYKSQLYRDRH